MQAPSLLLILPVYKKFAFARRAAESFFATAPPDAVCLVVDDASPIRSLQDWSVWSRGLPADRLLFRFFEQNGGLTRSWNWGLRRARKISAEVTIAGNSDLYFPPYWWDALEHHLACGVSLAGPITNAPGMNSKHQHVVKYYPRYRNTDDPEYLRQVSEFLRFHTPLGQFKPGSLNGFCLVARTATWWEGSFDEKHVFNPIFRMAGNEDELQARWRQLGWKIGCCPASFVFHYRAVSRGERHKHTGWFRPDQSTHLVK